MTTERIKVELTAENAEQFGIIVPEGVPFERIFDNDPLSVEEIKAHTKTVDEAMSKRFDNMRDEIDLCAMGRDAMSKLMLDYARTRCALLLLASAVGEEGFNELIAQERAEQG